MKTFEERYTAWIDGRLEGPTLAAFEQELARRSAAGEAEADRTDSSRLRHLLREHFEAPEMTNGEFFSHQLRERINTERAATGRHQAGAPAKGIFALFPWSVARLAGLGAACLFVAGALYYGLEPRSTPDAGQTVAVTTPAQPQAPQPPVAENPPAEAPAAPRDSSGPTQLVFNSPTPAPPEDASFDIQVHDNSAASATPLHYKKPNVNVLWTNGLNYLPDLPGTPAPGAPAPSPSASVVP